MIMIRGKLLTSGLTLCAIASAMVSTALPARCDVGPAGNGRFYVELKDASLADALEMIFKAAGNPSHIIDEAAKAVNLGAVTFNNAQWDNVVRQLVNQNNFKLYRNASGTYIVEPRVPVAATGTGPGSGQPFPGGGQPFGAAAPPGPFGATVPANPFGGVIRGNGEIRTVTNMQTAPDLSSSSNGTDSGDDGKEYRLITVRHVYEGGIAILFGKATVVSTEQFVSPSNSGKSKSGGGGGSSFGSNLSGSSGISGGVSTLGSGGSSSGGVSGFSFGGSSSGTTGSTGVSGFSGFGY